MLTPTLRKIKEHYPSSEVWLLACQGTHDILQGCSDVDHIRRLGHIDSITQDGVADVWGFAGLLAELRKQNFDYAFDLSEANVSHWLCALSGAKTAMSLSTAIEKNSWLRHFFRSEGIELSQLEDKHTVERDYFLVSDQLNLGQNIPKLTFERDACQYWNEPLLEHRFVIFHPYTHDEKGVWTIDRWLALGKYLIRRDFAIVVSSGHSEAGADMAQRIVNGLGQAAVVTDTELTWGQLAGILHQAQLLVSVDSEMVHLAAACDCHVVALYGQTSAERCYPWQVDYQLIYPDNRYSDFDPTTESVYHIQLHQVQEACQFLFK